LKKGKKVRKSTPLVIGGVLLNICLIEWKTIHGMDGMEKKQSKNLLKTIKNIVVVE